MKIGTFTKNILLLSLLFFVGDRALAGISRTTEYEKESVYNAFQHVFIDKDVSNFPAITNPDVKALQLFSHGRPGQLLLGGRWRNAAEIAQFIRANKLLEPGIEHINIYGCNFGRGPVGRTAVAYLEQLLGVSVAASNNITGKNGDWVLEVGAGENALSVPAFSGNLQYSPVDDLDEDGIANVLDLDDDNDGILDAVEAPSCYFLPEELVTPALVTTSLTTVNNTSNGISRANDGDITTYAYFNPNAAIANVTLYEVTPATPVAISSMNFTMYNWYMTANANSTVMLQGFNGTTWDTLGTIAAHNVLPAAGAADTFKNTLHPAVVYTKFRIRGVAGTAYYSGVREITFSLNNYQASANAKSTCAVDDDDDGVTNDQDLDSDGDGCPDTREQHA